MKRLIFGLIILALLALIAAGSYYTNTHSDKQKAHLSAITLPDIFGTMQSGEQWLGNIVVLNHWATWCPPCREEIPMLDEFHRQMREQNVIVVGISHDFADKTRIFGDQIGLSYPSLVIGYDGAELIKAHGNDKAGALPFTVIFDRSGKIVKRHLGLVKREQLDAWVAPLLH